MKLKVLFAAALLTLTSPSFAHAPKSSHGGRIVMAGPFHVEMVARDNAIDVHLLDHTDKPIAITGYRGVAILAVEGKSQRIVLEPAGGTHLSGKPSGKLPKQPKGVVQITSPNGSVVSANFN